MSWSTTIIHITSINACKFYWKKNRQDYSNLTTINFDIIDTWSICESLTMTSVWIFSWLRASDLTMPPSSLSSSRSNMLMLISAVMSPQQSWKDDRHCEQANQVAAARKQMTLTIRRLKSAPLSLSLLIREAEHGLAKSCRFIWRRSSRWTVPDSHSKRRAQPKFTFYQETKRAPGCIHPGRGHAQLTELDRNSPALAFKCVLPCETLVAE